MGHLRMGAPDVSDNHARVADFHSSPRAKPEGLNENLPQEHD